MNFGIRRGIVTQAEHKLEKEMVELLVKHIEKGMQLKTAIYYGYKVLRGLPLLIDIAENPDVK